MKEKGRRDERVARAQELRATGMLLREIAVDMEVAECVSSWLTDPTGANRRRRTAEWRAIQPRETSSEPCRCGCGQPTVVARWSDASRGWVKGQPQPYLRGHRAYRELDAEYVRQGDGCWPWLGSVDAYGYGQASRKHNGERIAHRVVYQRFRGPIPNGLHLHHVCENKLCVNPDHLSPVAADEHQRLHAATRNVGSDVDTQGKGLQTA